MDIDRFGPVEHNVPNRHGILKKDRRRPADGECIAHHAAPTGRPLSDFIAPTESGRVPSGPAATRRYRGDPVVFGDSFMSLRQLQQLTIDRIMEARFIRAILDGSIRRGQYRAYLTDVWHYARYNAEVIALAGSRLAQSHPQLAEYLLAHASEEVSHDAWVQSDLRELGLPAGPAGRPAPSGPCLQMLGLEFLYAAHLNPLGIFGWLFVVRSVGSRFGGEIVGALDKALRLDGKALAFLTSHSGADIQHAEDLLGIIDTHVSAEADRDSFVRMMSLSCDLYIAMFDAAVDGVHSVRGSVPS